MYLEDKINEIDKLLYEYRKNRIYIWGVGEHSVNLLRYSNILNYDIVGFIDKNKKQEKFFGFEVLSPEDCDWNDTDCIVISSFKFQNEILQQINNMGFKGKIVTLYSDNVNGEFYHFPSKKCQDFYFTGQYDLWEMAENNARGYDENGILQKVYEATLQVINGEAAYERDSVLFYDPQYNFRLLSLFGKLAKDQKKINILDFGGALGSEYWKNRCMLEKYNIDYTWNVVEQKNYVSLGKNSISDERLFFFDNVSEIKKSIDIVLLSSVLQYLENYEEIIKQILALSATYILIDRQCVSNKTMICVQVVGANIYNASYPVRIIAENELLSQFKEEYELVTVFDSEADRGHYYLEGKEFYYRGYLYERKVMQN